MKSSLAILNRPRPNSYRLIGIVRLRRRSANSNEEALDDGIMLHCLFNYSGTIKLVANNRHCYFMMAYNVLLVTIINDVDTLSRIIIVISLSNIPKECKLSSSLKYFIAHLCYFVNSFSFV